VHLSNTSPSEVLWNAILLNDKTLLSNVLGNLLFHCSMKP
jgi:hypothetical protein